MSEVQQYISNAYSDSQGGFSSVGDFTYGGLDSSTMFGNKGSSTTGIRMPSARTSEQGSVLNTGMQMDFNLGNYNPTPVSEAIGQQLYQESKAPKFDFAGALTSGAEQYSQFVQRRQNRKSGMNTDPSKGGAAGMIDGVPVDMDEVLLDGGAGPKGNILGTERGTMDDGSTGAGYAAAGQAVDLIGTGVEMAFDDEDATKWNAGEITGSALKGIGKGAATGATIGTAIGTIVPGAGNVIGAGVGAAVGAVVGLGANIIGGITGRNKARRKKAEAEKKAWEEALGKATDSVRSQAGQLAQARVSQRSASAAAGLEAAQEKYKLSTGGRVFSDEYLQFRKSKKMYNNGGRITKLAIQNNRQNRPEHLKYEGLMGELKLFDLYNKEVTPIKKPEYNTDYSEINQHLEKGGMIEYEDGGLMESSGESTSGSGLSSTVSDSFYDFAGTEQFKVGTKQGIKHGVKTGIKYGTTRAAAAGLLNKFGARVGSKFIPGVGQAWLMGDIGYYGTKWMTKHYAKAHNEIFGPALDDVQSTHGEETRKKVENTTHTYGVSGIGSGYSAKLEKGGKISYDVEDYLTSNYKDFVKGGMIEKYKTGGMTQGEFSHDNNPLTVVDKDGQDTGMELTGGEGVFDQKAMTMLDKYKQNKDYSKAGKLVFSEMDTWKDAGTAKYGNRIKEYYG